jgi:hypothetical protein
VVRFLKTNKKIDKNEIVVGLRSLTVEPPYTVPEGNRFRVATVNDCDSFFLLYRLPREATDYRCEDRKEVGE